MTRLKSKDLSGLGQSLANYDQELKEKTGFTLRQIACRAAGIGEEQVKGKMQETKAGVISISAGEGILSMFAESVRDVVRHLGFNTIVPDETDVTGFAIAIEAGANVIFMADDLRFIAYNTNDLRIIDNGEATGRGYGAALEGLVNGFRGRPVLVIGAGRVGTAAARVLKEMSVQISIYDPDTLSADRLAREVSGTVEEDLEKALNQHSILFDASPASEIIEARHVKPITTIAAPGIPLALTAEARLRVGDRLIHDPLQIGVATMAISAITPCV